MKAWLMKELFFAK